MLVVVAAGFALTRAFENDLVEQLDTGLRGAASRIGEAATSGERLPTTTNSDDLVQRVDEDGEVRFATERLRGQPALWTPGEPVLRPATVRTEIGNLRVVGVSFRDDWLVLADPLEPIEADVSSLSSTMALAAAPVTLVLGSLLWFMVGRTLRPVAASVAREEQLVADVGHELRSPLAGVKVLLETEPEDALERSANRRAALATLSRLEATAEQLLAAATTGDRQEARPVDLDEILLRQVQMLEPAAHVDYDVTGVVAGQVYGHPMEMESMVENLLTNATRHARDVVTLQLREALGEVELAVDDDGPGIAPDDRARVFERFTRLDEGRSSDRGGSGLGLAIVQQVVTSHGGSIELTSSPHGGARFVVRLPATT